MPFGGGLASIFVSGLTGTPGLVTASSALPLPYQLAGVSVGVNGAAAPILAVFIPEPGSAGYAQINIQIPSERNETLTSHGMDTGGRLTVAQQNQMDTLTPLPGAGWGSFFADANGYVIAQHSADYRTVTAQNPARAGESIILYANDFFGVWPPPPIAFPAPLQPLFLPLNPVIFAVASYYAFYSSPLFLQAPPTTVGPNPIAGGPGGSCANTPAVQITFEGLAPGLVGVEQINFVVPANQQPGDWTLFFNTGTSADGRTCDTLHGSTSSVLVKLPVR
jgi:uncharacterized protein (TIGR03437 family)